MDPLSSPEGEKAILESRAGFECRLTMGETPLQLIPAGTLMFRKPLGGVYLHLEMVEIGILHFYRSTPGTGTQMSRVDVRPLGNAARVWVACSWEPLGVDIKVWDDAAPTRCVIGERAEPDRKFQIDVAGGVNTIARGVSRVEAYFDGRAALRSSAIDAWVEIARGVALLLEAEAGDGADFALLAPNLAQVTLVTGWETYGKRRFVELIEEGVRPNDRKLEESFLSKRERELGMAEDLKRDARRRTLAEALVERDRIPFQSYEGFKKAFARGYGVSIGSDLGIDHEVLGAVKRGIGYRHRIVHVSPFLGLLNPDTVHDRGPEGGNHEFAYAQLAAFDRVVRGLHARTLRLKRG